MIRNRKYRYSEIFRSLQGEGEYTGAPTMWIRWFLCNLQCNGFGQLKPEDPSTHILPYKTFDVSSIKKIEDLPVWTTGCDSSYSWSKKYRHLCHEETASEIVDKLQIVLQKDNRANPDGRFNQQRGRGPGFDWIRHHLCFTGGEPMMAQTQQGMIDVLVELERRNNLPFYITIESNGTQPLSTNLADLINSYKMTGGDWFWSISPKLLYTSGEQPKKAIRPEIVASYKDLSNHGQLKFVVSNREEAWDELEDRITEFRLAGVDWPVWIMPVGATVESQESDDTRAVVEETIKRGYKVSARIQAYIWGNKIGT